MGRHPEVTTDGGLFTRVEGVFFRAVDPAHLAAALEGSRAAGRYSAPEQPTLYLGSSAAGVAAAMAAHAHDRAAQLHVIRVRVRAQRIFDLRDERACGIAGVSRDDPAAPWQEVVAEGGRPLSWAVRNRLAELGAQGLIDPSRRAPGLWHLVLFRWNRKGAPSVTRCLP